MHVLPVVLLVGVIHVGHLPRSLTTIVIADVAAEDGLVQVFIMVEQRTVIIVWAKVVDLLVQS